MSTFTALCKLNRNLSVILVVPIGFPASLFVKCRVLVPHPVFRTFCLAILLLGCPLPLVGRPVLLRLPLLIGLDSCGPLLAIDCPPLLYGCALLFKCAGNVYIMDSIYLA